MCVLLVEDEPLIRTVMVESLQDAGFQVIEASNGDEAAALIANHSIAFSVLVTDVNMPGALDGLAVARCMRRHHPGTPIVVASGRPDVLDACETNELGSVMLHKPYTPRELIAALHGLLGHRG